MWREVWKKKSPWTLEMFLGHSGTHLSSQYLGQRGRRIKSGFEVNLGYMNPIFLFYFLNYILCTAELWLRGLISLTTKPWKRMIECIVYDLPMAVKTSTNLWLEQWLHPPASLQAPGQYAFIICKLKNKQTAVASTMLKIPQPPPECKILVLNSI